MSNEKLAFFIGLLGSLHCIGMCGPLAFAVPVQQTGWGYLLWNKLIYQLGRIISYGLLGALVGLLGKQIWQAGFQQGISIFTGVMIVLAAASRLLKWALFRDNPAVFLKPFNRMFDYAFRHKANHLIIGMINGLLPCGFVYLALAGALNTENMSSGVKYMLYFGLGTLPLMLLASIVIGFSGQLLRAKLNRYMPYAMLFLGLWFILRGLELNIPYLSPQAPLSQTTECR
jgi:sulfite exporter TauE/SafE